MNLPHALLDDRVTPCLADDDVRPLHDDDADEERGVAGVLKNLPLVIGLSKEGKNNARG